MFRLWPVLLMAAPFVVAAISWVFLAAPGKGRGPDSASPRRLLRSFARIMTVRRMQAEQRDGIGCVFAPVETGVDRSGFLLRRSDRAGDAFGRSPPRAIAQEMKRTVGGL